MKIKFNLGESNEPFKLTLSLLEKSFTIPICHRKPNRTICFFGLQKYFCSRCVGIILGMITGILLIFSGYYLTLETVFILSLPISIDGVTQYMGLRKSNNILRISSGFLFGLNILIWGRL